MQAHILENNALGQDINIVRLLGYAVYQKNQMFRTYCEYCPHGDLSQLTSAYLCLEESTEKYGKPRGKKFHVPSHALWCIFEAMVNSICILRHGTLPGQPAPEKKEWLEFLHRDIKPLNGEFCG